jgi:hypothetical protein
MRDDEEARLVVTPEPVISLGPSVYTGPAGHAPGAGRAVDPTAAPAGPCVYTPAESTHPNTSVTPPEQSTAKKK